MKMSLKDGLFITLEGGEGSGKTTTAQLIASWIKEQGFDVLITREPGGVHVSERIRDILVNEDMSPLTEAMLFASSRNEIVHKLILPALEEGKVVICDRFVDSSYVYQGMVKGLGLDMIERINQPIMDQISPDITLYLDLHPEIAFERIRKNKRETNKFEKESIDFHYKVRDSYQKLANMEKHKERIHTINANQPVNKVAAECITLLMEHVFQDNMSVVN